MVGYYVVFSCWGLSLKLFLHIIKKTFEVLYSVISDLLMFLLCFVTVCKPLPFSSHPTTAAAAADPVNKESVIPVTSSVPWTSPLSSLLQLCNTLVLASAQG